MISDIILMQKREIEQKLTELYIEREINHLIKDNDLIKVISGPRRAGKSFFAMHLLSTLGSYGYINFDDERLYNLDNYDLLLASLNTVYDNPKHILLDEIQNLSKWELFVNRLQRQGYRLIITGSNAHLLSKELATHLTGRHEPIILFPFSFSEFIKSLPKELTDVEKAQEITTYMSNGGLPEPLLKNVDRHNYLSTLLDSIIYKDIVKRHRIRSVQGIEDLTKYLLTNITNEYSFQTLSKVTKCKSVHTVEKYLRHLEEAFIFFSVKRFSNKLREQLRLNKKIYCIDNGFVTSHAFQLTSNTGKLCENLVAIALKKKEMENRIEFYFWKNQKNEEVDFVIKENRKVTQLIQVCWDLESPKTKEREIRALLKASKELKCNNCTIITEKTEDEQDATWFGIKEKIRFIPLWKLLLNYP